MAFYSDKASVFYVKQRSETAGKGVTQFGRALYDLNIDAFCANTSQAKGRVERANQTLQDRLAKELRLPGISTSRECICTLLHRRLQPALRQATQERLRCAPAAARRRGSAADPGNPVVGSPQCGQTAVLRYVSSSV
ncbi:hypothetical protein HDG40_007548 [Paraburkholderia sp. JPY158]|uniref:Integrase catalytic domain-containing protein n=1 Tax=Paraburkholderia atlantica TaxID=2654982 RepID=A0A7W8QGV1_PARAM|nr:hypothetical protein [Paraburkholderia atlantica]